MPIYVGGRYMPKFSGDYNITQYYEALTVADYNNIAYITKRPAPPGILPTNTNYWSIYAAGTGAVDHLQSEIDELDRTKADIDSLATVATSGSYNDLSNKPTIPAAQIQSDWAQTNTSSKDYIKNKPTLATVATSGSYNDLSSKPTIPAAQIQSDWAQTNTSSKDYIKNKPTLATVATSGDYDDLSNKPTLATVATSGSYNDLSNKPTLATVATSGSYNDLSNKPTIPAAQIQSDWAQTNTSSKDYIKNKPTLATVATSGSYNDLSNKPTIPAAQIQSNWAQTNTSSKDYIKNKPTLATVATSGSYNDLSNKPTIPTVNNATLTIQKNGVNVQTFTANSSSNKTANIIVPVFEVITKSVTTGSQGVANLNIDSTKYYVVSAYDNNISVVTPFLSSGNWQVTLASWDTGNRRPNLSTTITCLCYKI